MYLAILPLNILIQRFELNSILFLSFVRVGELSLICVQFVRWFNSCVHAVWYKHTRERYAQDVNAD